MKNVKKRYEKNAVCLLCCIAYPPEGTLPFALLEKYTWNTANNNQLILMY